MLLRFNDHLRAILIYEPSRFLPFSLVSRPCPAPIIWDLSAPLEGVFKHEIASLPMVHNPASATSSRLLSLCFLGGLGGADFFPGWRVPEVQVAQEIQSSNGAAIAGKSDGAENEPATLAL